MYKNIVNYLSYIPKHFVTAVAALALVMAPLQIVAQETARLEASIKVTNATTGDGVTYHETVNAKYDEVVQFQIFYHNMEKPDSGIIAENLRVNVDMPTTAGKTQNVAMTVTADNSNTVADSTSVNLNREDARLEFIPGSVNWRHNAGTNDDKKWVTENLPDSVVTGDGFTVIEDAQPCENFAATITFQARVMVPSVSIQKQVSTPGSEAGWQESITVKPGTRIKYLLTVTNNGNTTLENVGVSDKLPANVTYVPGSTVLVNSNHPSGISIASDRITKGGININAMGVGSNAHVTFEAIVAEEDELECGISQLKNVGVASADEVSPLTDNAIVKVNKVCEEQPPVPPVPPEQPEVPAEELPVTGPAETAAGLLASGGLGVAIRAYARSRKDLLSALLNK